jgi:hypothetical protein
MHAQFYRIKFFNDPNMNRQQIQNFLKALITAFILVPAHVYAGPVDHWQQRSPLPTGYDFFDMTFGKGKFVGVGYGPIETSTNGVNWDVQNAGGGNYDVTFGNQVFVATRLNNTVVVSGDGVNWASIPVPFPMEGIGFCNGLFVGGGYDFSTSTAGILSSPDGTNWTRRATIPGNVTQVCYGGGRYVATGYSGNVYVSTNLTDWITYNTGSVNALNGVCYANGRYVVVGDDGGAYVSTNAVNWTHWGSSGFLNRVIFANGTFVAIGKQSQSLISTNGTNWVNISLPAPLNIWITYGGVAYGNGVFTAGGSRGQVSTSTDGTNWTSRFHGTVEDLYGVAYGSNQWIAVGNLAETITSTNGMDWITRRSQYSGILMAAAYTNGLYVVANNDNGYGSIVVSSNLNNWTDYYPQPGPALYALAYGSNTWVAVGYLGAIWTSINGAGWQIQTLGNGTDLTGIVYAQNKFVAVGDQGLTMNSPDGIIWSTNNSTTTAHLNGIVYGQGDFLAVGVNGTMVLSKDGIHWSPHSLNTTANFTSIAYGDGYFAVVGLEGEILTSSDSWYWTVQLPSSSFPLLSVAYGDHNFLAVGQGGMMFQSDPFINASISRSNFPVLGITGPANRLVSIQTNSSLNALSPWNDIATISLTNQPTIWKDPQPGVSSRFYRVKLLQ